MIFLPEASFGLRVLSLPASVCVSVCLSVCQSLVCPSDNSGHVSARITKFGPNMQNTLVRVPIVLWTDRPWLQGQIQLEIPNLLHFELVCNIPHHSFKPGSSNLNQRCKIHWLRSRLFCGAIDLDLRVQIWLTKWNFQVLPYRKYIPKQKWNVNSHSILT